MQTIDDEGNVIFWTNLDSNGTTDRLVLGLADGSLLIAARREILPRSAARLAEWMLGLPRRGTTGR